MKKYTRILIWIAVLSLNFVNACQSMDPKEELWQDMIGIAESRARYNTVIHNMYTHWQEAIKIGHKEIKTADIKKEIDNFTQQLLRQDYEYLMLQRGIFDKKQQNIMIRNARIMALEKLPRQALENKISWEFFARSLKAFSTPEERLAIWPRLIEELDSLRAENLGALSKNAEGSDGFEADEFTYTIVLLEKLKTYTQKEFAHDNRVNALVTQVTPVGSSRMRLTQAVAETKIAELAEKEVTMKMRVPSNPQAMGRFKETRGFVTQVCSFIKQHMSPISDQPYVDRVLEFLSTYVIQPDIDHLKTNFPLPQEGLQRRADPWLPSSLRTSALPGTSPNNTKPPSRPSKANDKKKIKIKNVNSSMQRKQLSLPPLEENKALFEEKNDEALEINIALSPTLVNSSPPDEPLQEEEIHPAGEVEGHLLSLQEEVTPPTAEVEKHLLRQELNLAFTDVFELKAYSAVFKSQSDRAQVNFEDLTKGKTSTKPKKSDGLSWDTFVKFLTDKGWGVDQSLSKGSSVSFLPPQRFASLTGLIPKRINVHKPKDTKIPLYEGYLKFFRSGFDSMGLTEQSLKNWGEVLMPLVRERSINGVNG